MGVAAMGLRLRRPATDLLEAALLRAMGIIGGRARAASGEEGDVFAMGGRGRQANEEAAEEEEEASWDEERERESEREKMRYLVVGGE